MVLNHPSDSKKHEGELEGEIDDEYDELDVYDHHMQTTITDTLELREEEHNHPFVHDPFSEHMHHHEILRRSQNRNVQNTIGHQQQESKMCQVIYF
jgi:hypothetical protein